MLMNRLPRRRMFPGAALASLVAVPVLTLAQQSVPFQGNIPLAPRGLEARPLPDEPVVYDTAEDMEVRVSVVVRGLRFPFSLTFLPGGDMLVTERTGNLRRIRGGALDPDPVPGVPASVFEGESGLPGTVHGLMDIHLHPDFETNQFVYFTYTKPAGNRGVAALARGRWDGEALVGTEDVFVAAAGGASRFAFGLDGTIFLTIGGGDAQDPSSHGGKVLRIHDDGSVPSDNPFVGMEGYAPEVYSLGHRTALGLAVHPVTGAVWQNENGPNGGDEINVIQAGRNYGWPEVSFGRTYQGPWQAETPTHSGFENPLVYWMPSIAVSGMAFYTGDRLPKWKGDVFVGGLRYGEIPGTGQLQRILFNENMEELRREVLLADLRQRIRDVRMGPDELLYVVTDEADGAVLRIEPAN